MSLQDFKVLTFDVVGTLIDFEGGMLAYLRSAVPDSRVTDEDFLAAYRHARADGTAGWYPDDLARCWHAIAPKLGLPDTDVLAQGLRDELRILADVRSVRSEIRDCEELCKLADDGGFVLLSIGADSIPDLGRRRPGHCLPGNR